MPDDDLSSFVYAAPFLLLRVWFYLSEPFLFRMPYGLSQYLVRVSICIGLILLIPSAFFLQLNVWFYLSFFHLFSLLFLLFCGFFPSFLWFFLLLTIYVYFSLSLFDLFTFLLVFFCSFFSPGQALIKVLEKNMVQNRTRDYYILLNIVLYCIVLYSIQIISGIVIRTFSVISLVW